MNDLSHTHSAVPASIAPTSPVTASDVAHSSPVSGKPTERSGVSEHGVSDAMAVQILATEHWSLLATRGMTWNEVFSRASMFVTVLSAAVVSLALVAQATAFGPAFRLVALLVLPVVLLVGVGTLIRLSAANTDDLGLVVGMNRLRHAYLELAPGLEPYFVTAHHDDRAGILQSYGLGYHPGLGHALSGAPVLVAAINALLAGVLAALVAMTAGASEAICQLVGVAAALATALSQSILGWRAYRRANRMVRPRFPH